VIEDKGKIGRGGGDRTIKAIASAQVIHSTFRSIRKNRQNRMSEVHGGDTGFGLSVPALPQYRHHSLLFVQLTEKRYTLSALSFA
jgi:hypothetical protein